MKTVVKLKTVVALIVLATWSITSCEKGDESVKVESIILDATETTIFIGKSGQLSVEEVLPANATEKGVTWSSDNTDRAMVDAASGKVTVPATATIGTVNITATAKDGSGVKAICVVTVAEPAVKVTSITLETTEIVILIGESKQLSVKEVRPANATEKGVTWSSDNIARATVDAASGKVSIPATATGGTVKITATAKDGSGVKAVCTVIVPDNEEGVEINGIIWATRNVDAVGTFSAKPESSGMFYQWDRKKAWAATGDVTGWDDWNYSNAAVWSTATDPSPYGWRVPTWDEFFKLIYSPEVDKEWVTENYIKGVRFTDKVSKKSIFFPAAGCRGGSYGNLVEVGIGAYYWSSTSEQDSPGANAFIAFEGMGMSSARKTSGCSIRCVKK